MIALLFIASQHAIAQKAIQSSDGVEVNIEDISRIITIGGSITETVYALGGGEYVVATDVSSNFPKAVFSLPKVPYVRNLTSEGILSLSPTLIVSSDDANPKSAIQQIRDAGTSTVLIKEQENLEGVINKLRVIGKILKAEPEAQTLINKNKREFHIADSIRHSLQKMPTVMFVLATRGAGNFMMAGNNTGAQSMIELAGGRNALQGFDGYKPVTPESIIAANPDYILVMDSRYDEVKQALKQTPAINSLKSIRQNSFISMDGNYLLGFGPRFGSAILDLMRALHPELSVSAQSSF